MNKAKQYFRSHNARALNIYGLVPDFSFEQFESWYSVNYGQTCPCGAKDNSIDHIIPLARGGAQALGNFQFLCRPCNSRKADWLVGEVRIYPWPYWA
jgi:5-methylcytosine-specific restriction endonuclease McrA